MPSSDYKDLIDTQRPPWTRWGCMLLEHPNMLAWILGRLPKAPCEMSAALKTAAIHDWLKALDVPRMELVCTEYPFYYHSTEDNLPTINILFRDSPYSSSSAGVPLIGNVYSDPDFPKHTPQSVQMINGRRPDPDYSSFWHEEISKAERAYFSENALAPVAIFHWKSGSDHDFVRKEDYWEAADILSIPAPQRRMISGYRNGKDPDKKFLPFYAQSGAPEAALQIGNFSLDLLTYLPSPSLIASRNAKQLEEATGMSQSSAPPARRTL